MNDNKTKKILIIKIGAIGDVVMALSMLNAIDIKYPGAEVTWVCGKIVEPLLKCFNRINRLIIINEEKLLTGNVFNRFSEILKIWKKLFLSYFEIIIIPYKDSRYRILTFFTLHKLMKDLRGKNRLNLFVPGRYHSDEYAKLILAKDNWEMKSIALPVINLPDYKNIDEDLSSFAGDKIILNPGGAQNLLRSDELRRWQIENYLLLAKRLIEQSKNVILIGAASDNWVLEYFKLLPVISFIGKTSLPELVYLFNKCNLLVSHDTSAIHLAKLSSIKVVGLFGPTNPVEIAGAYENIQILFEGNSLSCSPCYDGKNFADCMNNICMKNITVEMVYKKVMEVLSHN